jgi:hypothetical protein
MLASSSGIRTFTSSPSPSSATTLREEEGVRSRDKLDVVDSSLVEDVNKEEEEEVVMTFLTPTRLRDDD